MKSLLDPETNTQLFLTLASGDNFLKDADKIANLLTPYIGGFDAIHKDVEKVGNFNKFELVIGIHIAFWIMHDEILKIPNDPLIFSNLMSKCFVLAEGQLAEKLEIITNLRHDLNEEQLLWLKLFLISRLGSHSLNFACLWSLLQIWDCLQKQDDFLQRLQRESTS